jgi:acyl-CoA reductase-like NAD-dependent aldehyde dehydrogenase
MLERLPLYLNGRPTRTRQGLEVLDKYLGKPIAEVSLADDDAVEAALVGGWNAAEPLRQLPAFRRREILLHCRDRLAQQQTTLVETLITEAGKPRAAALIEVERALETFRVAAEEATRLDGQFLELQVHPRAVGYRGAVRRFPVGLCTLVSPFNFPLNLAAHKVAPAIAAGCPWILKPASSTPLSALAIGSALAETDLPEGSFSILPASRGTADRLITDPRPRLLSFTGSDTVGWDLYRRAGQKKVVLELGGNAAAVVDETADLAFAADRIVAGAFSQAGQSCISVQRVIAVSSVYDALRTEIVQRAERVICGDPKDLQTVVGPLITSLEADRVRDWLRLAEGAGARRLCGGPGQDAMILPTVLEAVPENQPLWCDEAFAPVLVLAAAPDFESALSAVNLSRFGLQAGVFTRDIHRAFQAWECLEVGGVVVGDIPSTRFDHVPYGGVKASGLGREGVRSAIEEFTEPRTLIVREAAS